MSENGPPMYRMVITASGTVRDADGNVVNELPIEATAILTEDEARQLMQGDTP